MALDYTKFSKDGKPTDEKTAINKRWWSAKKTERAKSVWGVVQHLAQYDSVRQTQYELSAKLYGNTQLLGVTGLTTKKGAAPQATIKDRLTYNVVQSALDTVTSKIAKNKPKPLFLTSGGNWKLQRKAKKLDKFVEGCFYENDAYHLGTNIFRDGGVLGDGLVQVFEHYGRVKYERTLVSELYVDWFEAYYGNPRQLHRVKNVDRQVLIDLFPEHKRAIEKAKAADVAMTSANMNVADQVTVVESWHLPSGPDATDGLHTICLEEETLLDEEWKKPFFPFARFSWGPRLYGHWAQGGAEQIQNIQYEINKILWLIQRSFHLAGTFKVLTQVGSKVVKEHLNNDIGAIVEYVGTPPQYVTPPIVPIEMYQQLQNLKNAAYEQLGVSQLSAAAKKPDGLNSGKALREFNDIESDRFMTIGQAYERFFLELARLTVDCAKDIYAREGKYEVKVPGKKFIETIDWKEIDLEEDEYYLKIFPVSSLPNDPAGRLQTVQEYVQAGFISPRTARRLLDFPDLEAVEDLESAKEDYLHKILEKMVDADLEDENTKIEDVYTAPEIAYDDIPLARELALEYYQQGKLNNMPEANLQLLRDFISQLNAQPPGMPPMGPQGPMPGAPMRPAGGGMPAPQAAPMPQPQSDLIPNVPGAA
jgi:hypothetical protein